MKYRAPLDGLRALCVTSVFLFHGLYSRFGLFLGVDVFFVLSGYLITRILLEEVDRTGRVDFVNFYVRRARRLLPAVFIMLALVFALWPRDGEAGSYWRVVPPVLLYYVNWLLAFKRGSLWGLGHFWSLSIEEQFYLLWPVTVALLAVRGRRRTGLVIVGLVLLFAGARAALAGLAPPVGALFDYHATFARVDQLLIGALAACVHTSRAGERLAGVARRAVWPSIAFLVFCLARARMESRWLFLGGFSAVAVAGAFLIVHGSTGEPSPLNRLLQRPLLVWVGKRSYGIYVYHLAFLEVLEPLRRSGSAVNFVLVTALRAAATLSFAALSYRFVESRIIAPRAVAPVKQAA
ncbi:MAG TPA: acyltransferase [Polyangia bacterium]|nr:acyltransferase [Polyangia bacterium]